VGRKGEKVPVFFGKKVAVWHSHVHSIPAPESEVFWDGTIDSQAEFFRRKNELAPIT